MDIKDQNIRIYSHVHSPPGGHDSEIMQGVIWHVTLSLFTDIVVTSDKRKAIQVSTQNQKKNIITLSSPNVINFHLIYFRYIYSLFL